jgi:putative transcriptional regulator
MSGKTGETTGLRPMSEADILAAATSDADNPPLSDAELARLRPVPAVKTLRRALGLTQEAFSRRYAIPIGTLRDWEQGRYEPDAPARAYLKVIKAEPEAAARALAAQSS